MNYLDLAAQLIALPAAALRQLLQHERSCVASENTLAYTVLCWFDAQQGLAAGAAAQLGLLQLLRMRHCTNPYVSTVLAQDELFQACFEDETSLAVECSAEDGYEILRASTALLSEHTQRAAQTSNCAVLSKYPAWGKEKRPASEVDQFLEWKLSISELKSAVSRVLSSGAGCELHSSEYMLLGPPTR